MRLPPDGARWLISLRWLACLLVFLTIWVASSLLEVVVHAAPLYLIGCVMVAYNTLFALCRRRWTGQSNIVAQVLLDLLALTLLLYFADLPRNPFLLYFVFHMIIAGMYLRGSTPFFFAGLASGLVGAVMLLEYLKWIPEFALQLPSDPPEGRELDGLYLLGSFVAFASTLSIAVYFSTSIRDYVDQTHAEFRQKTKLLGIGQPVAGIAHQIANPLDGLQNCLNRIARTVKDDAHLTEYVQMMGEALERIERTAKRVQAFARPRGITLQRTDVNKAVESTLKVLGDPGNHVTIRRSLTDVPPVAGDPYTLQEVLFNLSINALAAMPNGGTLEIRTRVLGSRDDDQAGCVAIDVTDTGVGIPPAQLDRIFEPFYTTRADSGGTGLGLGLCRMMISEMGGRIEVCSDVDQGTTFTVVLNPSGDDFALKQDEDPGS